MKSFREIKNSVKFKKAVALSIIAVVTMVIVTVAMHLERREYASKHKQTDDEKDTEITIEMGEDVVGFPIKIIEVLYSDVLVCEFEGEEQEVTLMGIYSPFNYETEEVKVDGLSAVEYITSLLKDKEATIVFDHERYDEHDCLQGYIFLKSGEMLNGLLIGKGYNKLIPSDTDYMYQEEFEKLEENARENKLGIWDIEETTTEDDEDLEVIIYGDKDVVGEPIKIIDVKYSDVLVCEYEGVEQDFHLMGIYSPMKYEVEIEGLYATDYIAELTKDKKVTVVFDHYIGRYDEHDTLQGYIFLENGEMLNSLLIGKGFCPFVSADTDYIYQEEFEKLEEKAKENDLGIWSIVTDWKY